MKTLTEILNIIMTDISAVMPAQLAAIGLTDYAEYIIGMPRDPEKTTLSVMFDPDIPVDIIDYKYPILFYAQLYQVDYETSLGYTELLKKFARNYDSARIRASLLDSISINIIPLDQLRSTLIYLTATYSEPQDSCDREIDEDES